MAESHCHCKTMNVKFQPHTEALRKKLYYDLCDLGLYLDLSDNMF
jgi:hypothetical protein